MLVTGGAGFIGSNIVDRLVAEGHRVAIVDDLSAGRTQNVNAKATLHRMSVGSDGLKAIFQQEQPEYVYHLAAQASVSASVREPARDATTNVLGMINLLECARQSGVKKIIYSSTGGALYGEPERIPCDESHPIRPLSPYGLSKYVGEQYVQLYRRLHGLQYTILRYANVYGPRQDPHGEAGVVAIFTRLMLDGKQPAINGTGEQTRDFVFVGDVVDANMRAMDRGEGQAFNIGTGVCTSVNEVFESLKRATGFSQEAVHRPGLPGEVMNISLECSKARRELGWEPKIGLDEGLRLTVASLRGPSQARG